MYRICSIGTRVERKYFWGVSPSLTLIDSPTVDVGHMLTDQRGHAPCGLVSDAKLALQFLARNTMPRGGEQVDGIEPQLQRGAGLGERGANRGVQVMAAPLARIGALCLDPIPVRRALA